MAQGPNCPNCKSAVPNGNINKRRLVAVCPTCDTVFQFGEPSAIPERGSDLPTTNPMGKAKTGIKQKPHNVRPSRILRTFDDPQTGGFEIHKQDRNSDGNVNMGFLVFFTLFWDGFMIIWFVIAFSSGALEMALFGSLHGAVGVGLTYWLLAHFLNTTRIVVTREAVEVITTPIYTHAPRRFKTAYIDQIYVRATGYEVNGHHHYEVMADTMAEGAVKVCGGFMKYTDAAYVEREIEHYLAIEDVPVPGEANPYKVAY
jgi:hypothetical protein